MISVPKALDISHHQGSFDAQKAKTAGIDLVVIREAHGAAGHDRCFGSFVRACRAVALPIGVYRFCAWHFGRYNNSSVQQARQLMQAEISDMVAHLRQEGITGGLVALDQEAEPRYGREMSLGRTYNTALLNEAAALLREQGYDPALYVGASWCRTYVDVDRLQMPAWVAWYYADPNDPDFAGCADFHGRIGSNADLLRRLEGMDKLLGWQFGRINCGSKYGVGSTNIDRSIFYNKGVISVENFEKVESKQLVVTSQSRPATQAFVRPDITAPCENLELGSYPIQAIGPEDTAGGMTAPWVQLTDDRYVLALPDRCRVEDIPTRPAEPPAAEDDQLANAQTVTVTLNLTVAQLRKVADIIDGGMST